MQWYHLDRDLPWHGLQGGPQRLIPAANDHDLPGRPASPVIVKLMAEGLGCLLHRAHPLATSHQ